MDISLILLLAALIFLSAFSSASETAYFSLSTMKVKSFAQSGDDRKKRVAKLLMEPRQLLVTIMIINVLMNILIQNVISHLFGEVAGWTLAVGVPLVITLVFGDILPKSLGLANNERLAYIATPFIRTMQLLLYPIRKSLVILGGAVSRFFFFNLKKEKELSVEELEYALKESQKYGVLNSDEAELIQGYLLLEENTIRELMRPKEEILYFDLNQPLDKLLSLFVDEECSRIPVCDREIENIKGIITSRQYFLNKRSIQSKEDLLQLLEKPYFVPEAMSGHTLLHQLYSRKKTMAMVVDEYGSVSGLITLEDLIEEVVGEIADRRDTHERYTRSGDDVIIASGKLELDELGEIFDIPVKSEQGAVTIGGYLTEKLGDIPKTGTKISTPDFLFHILSSDPNRVRRVYVRRLSKPLKEA